MRRVAYIFSLALLVSCPLPCFAAAIALAKPLAVSPLTSPERVKPISSAAQPELAPIVIPVDPHPFLTEFYGPAKVEAVNPALKPASPSGKNAALESNAAGDKRSR